MFRRRNNIEHKLDMIYTALVVRDPGTSLAAEAYEGLRKQVIAAAGGRQAHLAQVAEFDVALRRGASTDDLFALSSQWLNQAGILVIDRVDDPSRLHAFESTLAPGTHAEVDIPAYVYSATGQVVRQGRLREARASQERTTRAAPAARETEVVASTPAMDYGATETADAASRDNPKAQSAAGPRGTNLRASSAEDDGTTGGK